MPKETKRENFEVTPEQAQAITHFQELANATSRKDAMLAAIRLGIQLGEEVSQGKQIYVSKPGFLEPERVLLPFGASRGPKYLVQHDHPWKRQLFVKGRKLPAANVWVAMRVNNLTAEEAAEDWDLPIEAIYEIEEYCEANQALLQMEAAEEKRRLEEKGISVEPKTPRR
ncbi:MAG: hypothetical protein K2X29_02460 [Candidatus Obscuribacterales bacterium]|nr:hypothetical protein [Candidatus Obscuribacterales bacterium]